MAGPILGTGVVTALRRRFGGSEAPAAPEPAAPMTAATYLARYYATVPGFSSQFSAEVAVRLLACQQAAGISGAVGEIGVLMGRSFIALALASAPGETCLAIDDFTWPEHVEGVFLANCRSFGVDMARLVTIAANTTTLAAADILARLDGGRLRYLHVDGGHTPAVLRHDLALARAVLAPDGIICLDDMLHAQYPELGAAVQQDLAAHPDFVVFCVVDRADLIAASKFLLCRRDHAAGYAAALRAAFPDRVFPEAADFSGGPALILSPDAGLVAGYRSLIERAMPGR